MNKALALSFILFIEGSVSCLHSQNMAIAVSLPDTTAEQYTSIAIPIRVGDLSQVNVFSYQTTITFDEDIIDARGASNEGTLSQFWGAPTINTQQAGQITIGGFGTSPLTGQGILVFLEFDVIGQPPATTNINFVNFVFNNV